MSLTYTVIQHSFRKENDLSCNEYVLADMVYHLSTNPRNNMGGWCHMTRENMALEMGLSKVSVINIINSLEEKGFLVKEDQTKFLRTTDKWMVVYGIDDFTNGKESLPASVKKVYQDGKESLPYNNNKYKDNSNYKKNKKEFNKKRDSIKKGEEISNEYLTPAQRALLNDLYLNDKKIEIDYELSPKEYIDLAKKVLSENKSRIEILFMKHKVDLSFNSKIWSDFLENAVIHIPKWYSEDHVFHVFRLFIEKNSKKYEYKENLFQGF